MKAHDRFLSRCDLEILAGLDWYVFQETLAVSEIAEISPPLLQR